MTTFVYLPPFITVSIASFSFFPLLLLLHSSVVTREYGTHTCIFALFYAITNIFLRCFMFMYVYVVHLKSYYLCSRILILLNKNKKKEIG